MGIDEVHDFVRTALDKGASLQEVKAMLAKQGWPAEAIKKVLQLQKHAQDIPLLQVQNLTKSYDKDIILNCINLDIFAGEIFGIIGVSGCGKTTLLKSLVGFVDPDEGGVRINVDADLTYDIDMFFRNPHAIKSLFGFSTQSSSFYENLTVEENLEHFASLYGLNCQDIQKNKASLLKLLGLATAGDHLAGTLSIGMQKRLDIACALMHNPKILILDEPTSNLDPFLGNEMWALIQEINKTGTTVIIASHFLNELELFCTRIAVLYNHSIAAVGTPLELKKYYTNNYEIHFQLASRNYEMIINKLKRIPDVKISKVRIENHKAVLYTPVSQIVLQELLAVINKNREILITIDVHRPSITEIFETMLKK